MAGYWMIINLTMIHTVGLSCLWNKWNILCTVVKLIWDAIVEDYQNMLLSYWISEIRRLG